MREAVIAALLFGISLFGVLLLIGAAIAYDARRRMRRARVQTQFAQWYEEAINRPKYPTKE